MDFIYFCGDDKVGKSTMANSLQELIQRRYRKPAIVASFADGVRDELVNLYGIHESIIWNKSVDKNMEICLGDYIYEGIIPVLWKKYGLIKELKDYSDVTLSLRELFVTHGTKIRRQENDLYWMEKLQERIKSIQGLDAVIIDDARSPSDFSLGHNKKIIYLYNNLETKENLEQDRFRKWLEKNKDQVATEIEVPVPLLQYHADRFNKSFVFPILEYDKK